MDEELYDLLKQKRKDDAIKYIRNKYDMDFKSAKETIDKMTKTLEYFEGKNRGLSKEDFHDMFKNSIISRIYDNDLYALIRENRKIEAVKYVKEKYKFDLEKAKAMVDTLEPEMFTEKSIISTSNSNSSNFTSGYSIGNYSYKMIDGEQLYYTYKDGEKKEVNRVSIPRDILKDFEESADEYEDKRIKRKNILLGILLVIIMTIALIISTVYAFATSNSDDNAEAVSSVKKMQSDEVKKITVQFHDKEKKISNKYRVESLKKLFNSKFALPKKMQVKAGYIP